MFEEAAAAAPTTSAAKRPRDLQRRARGGKRSKPAGDSTATAAPGNLEGTDLSWPSTSDPQCLVVQAAQPRQQVVRRLEPIRAPARLSSPAPSSIPAPSSSQRGGQRVIPRRPAPPPPSAEEIAEAERQRALAHVQSQRRLSKRQEESAHLTVQIDELGRSATAAASVASQHALTIQVQGNSLFSLNSQLNAALDEASKWRREYRKLFEAWEIQRDQLTALQQRYDRLLAEQAPYQPSDAAHEAGAGDF